MVLPAVHKSHSVVWLALHLRCGSWIHLHHRLPDGASGSATDMATIPGITRGGDRWGTTDMAGIPITAGEHGEEPRSPTYTECGATRHTLVPARRGQIPTPATTERRRAEPTTTPRPAGPRSQVAAPTPTSTRATRPAIAAVRPTIRTPASSRAAEPVTRATSTAAKAQPDAVDLPTTRTRAGVAAGKNNVYAGKDGTVYRYNRQNGDWSSNSGSGWQSTNRPDANLQRQQQARTQGAQRTQNFNSTRSYGGGGGARMGGGRRR